MTVMEVGLFFIYFFFQLDSLLAGPFSVFFYYISYPFPQKIETAVGLIYSRFLFGGFIVLFMSRI